MKKGLVSLLAFSIMASCAVAENWPSWRGPKENGVSSEKNLPTSWKAGDEVWRAEIPGWGSSTPAIWDDHIFLTTAVDSDLFALCFNTGGKLLWKKPMGGGGKVARGGEGNSACISPVTDGKHVWVKTSNGLLVCFDVTGKEIWRTDMQERFGKYRIGFIVSSTPVLHDGKLFFHLMHDGESYVTALDAKTGKKRWYTVRDTGAQAECKHAYTSPFLYNLGGESVLVSHGSDFTIAYDLDSGKERWRCGGFQPSTYHRTLRFVSSPGMGPHLIVSPSAKNEAWLAIDPTGARKDITGSHHVKWSLPNDTPDVSCPLVVDDLVYISREKGGLVLCIDAKTGKVLYKDRIHEGLYRASPVYADGHVYYTCRDGVVSVIKTGRTLNKVSENKLNNEPMTASPAIANGVLYLRTHKALYALKK